MGCKATAHTDGRCGLRFGIGSVLRIDTQGHAAGRTAGQLLRGQGTDSANDPREQIQKHRALVDAELAHHFLKTSEMLGRHVAQPLRTASGQDHHGAPPVLRGRTPSDQTLPLQPVDQAGNRGPGDAEIDRQARGGFPPS